MQPRPMAAQSRQAPWETPGRRLLRGASTAAATPPRRAMRVRAPLAVCAYGGRPAGLQDPVDDQDDRNGDLVALARRRAQRQSAAPDAGGFGLGEFMRKLRAAWQIFFPERPRPLTPKEEGKRRLRMILVADRCGMSQESLADMRANIVRVVSDYVDIEADDLVEVNLSMDPELGTIYSVAVPVKRVKPQARVPLDGDADPDGITLSWDPNDLDSDPSGQFPYGA